MTTNPAIRVERNRPASHRLVDMCKKVTKPDHITKVGPDIYYVDLPPDVKAIVQIHTSPDPYYPHRKAHTVFIYRNSADREQGMLAIMEGNP